MVNISKPFSLDRKSPKTIALMLLPVVFIVGVFYYTSMPGPQRIINDIQATHELIKRLDRLIVSIQEKSTVDISLAEYLDEGGARAYEFFLSGVIWDVKKPLALLNNKVVGIGEEIEGFKVLRIKEKSVTLGDRHGKEQVIYIYENE